MSDPAVDIIPIGGVGHFGMNCTLVRAGDEVLIIDAGMAFSRGEAWGVDAIVPNLGELLAAGTRVAAVILTHGHEDHIGGLPYVLQGTSCPVYGSDLTLAFARERLQRQEEPATDRMIPVRGGQRIEAGPFAVQFVHVTHSVPGSFALIIETPAGVLVHSADFKLDPTPVDGPPSDLPSLAALAGVGVRLLLLDSTNAARDGLTPSERRVGEAFGAALASARGRVFITTFASHIHRIQQIVDCAVRAERRVAVVGRRMSGAIALARETGRLRIPSHALVPPGQAMDLPREKCVILAGGSQGEPASAMSRIARGEHPDAAISSGDTFVHSARPIPGSELAIARMLDEGARRGAEVSSGGSLHVSGHASAGELAELIETVRPETVLPVHGDYRHLLACARVAESHPHPPKSVLLGENGDIIRMDRSGVRITGRIDVRPMLVDRECDRVDDAVLRERRQIGSDGIVVPLVLLDRETGALARPAEIRCRGFAVPGGDSDLLREAARTVESSVLAARTGKAASPLETSVGDDLRRMIRKRTGKRPLVEPLVIEI